MSPIGIKILYNDKYKNLDDIFLKIDDYNTSVTVGDRQEGEGVPAPLTGITYIENGAVKDLNERYIGYDSSYNPDDYVFDKNRISHASMPIECNEKNLVDIFYQKGTKKNATIDTTDIYNGEYKFIRHYSDNHNQAKVTFDYEENTLIYIKHELDAFQVKFRYTYHPNLDTWSTISLEYNLTTIHDPQDIPQVKRLRKNHIIFNSSDTERYYKIVG